MFWKKRRSKDKFTALLRFGRILRWGVRILLLILIVDFFYLAVTWPDWKKIASGAVPKSAFISDYQAQQAQHKTQPRLRWQPVPLSTIPKHMIRAVILAEDSRFYQHSGFDLVAFKEAMDYNFNKGRFVLGASTISQQTAKNLFLNAAKNPLRKWHELILTWGMERHLSKKRILEIYFNVAEFGPGIYGVQAAAQAYWGLGAGQLSVAQAAELAATLPSPVKNNPATHTRHFAKRAKKILSLLERYPGDAAETIYPRHPDLFEPENAEPPADENEPPPIANESKPPVEEGSVPMNPL